ncbi:MAG: hypothetical protein AAB443_04480 [Patescibacteria group bacterium]
MSFNNITAMQGNNEPVPSALEEKTLETPKLDEVVLNNFLAQMQTLELESAQVRWIKPIKKEDELVIDERITSSTHYRTGTAVKVIFCKGGEVKQAPGSKSAYEGPEDWLSGTRISISNPELVAVLTDSSSPQGTQRSVSVYTTNAEQVKKALKKE